MANGPVPTAAGKGVIFSSASRAAAAYNSDALFNPGAKGVRLFISNDNAGGSTATVKIQVRMPGTTNWTDLTGAVTAALGNVTGSILTVYPSVTLTANVAIPTHLGSEWRVVLTIGTATGTSSVSADYLD